LSLVYGAGFLAAALYAQARGLGELAAAAAVVVAFYIPVIVFAALRLVGFGFDFRDDGVAAFYEWVSGGWIWLEIAGIAGAVALYTKFRAPLLGLPFSLFMLFLAMDGAARAVGVDQHSSNRAIGAFVLAFAVLAIAVGIWLDYRGFRRTAFWPHTFGAIGVVSGLEYLLARDSFQLALVLSGGVFLLLGIWLARIGYVVAGGVALWVGITAFSPSPILLTLSGLALVGAAIWLSLADSPLRRWLQTRPLPAPQLD
jgi:MFS-type transporter involved in bile tolerance (Atg22 family)